MDSKLIFIAILPHLLSFAFGESPPSKGIAFGELPLHGIHSRQKRKDSQNESPPLAFRRRNDTVTTFRKFYKLGDIPIALEHDTKGNKSAWTVDIEKLDYEHYLPLFFDGLRKYEFLAKHVHDMLENGGSKILPVIPRLITPIKNALRTRDLKVIRTTLKVLQKLLSVDTVGTALVPYYKKIMPTFNILKSKNWNSGDGINNSQQKGENIGDLVQETLESFERHGGKDAFINIKKFVPTYESYLVNL